MVWHAGSLERRIWTPSGSRWQERSDGRCRLTRWRWHSPFSGRVWGSGLTGLNDTHWRQLASKTASLQSDMESGLETLADIGAELVVELRPRTVSSSISATSWPQNGREVTPPIFVDSLFRPDTDSVNRVNSETHFLKAIAAAYQTGAPFSFAGLFTGEKRCRIAIPGYPFQCQRFWVQAR